MSPTVPKHLAPSQNHSANSIDPRLFLLSFSMFALGTDAFIIAGILPLLSRELGVTKSVAGQLVTSFALAYGVGAPLLAAVTGRWPRVRVLVITLGAFCLLNVGSALAPTFAMLLLISLLVGCCAALIAGGQGMATVLGVPLGTAGWYRLCSASALPPT